MVHSDISIGQLKLKVLTQDASWYKDRHVFEESSSSLYPALAREGFVNFIDVGANSGFVSILARRAMPTSRLFSIEADRRLVPLIGTNFDLNGLRPPRIIHAVATDHGSDTHTFSLNPRSTLDNRVNMEAWEKVTAPAISLDELVEQEAITGKTFIKIDTQGHEQLVLAGFERTMAGTTNWTIKMEFGPFWLRSQGADPAAFIGDLAERFRVTEVPGRFPFRMRSLADLRDSPVPPTDAFKFVEHVERLNRDGRGWVDILVSAQRNR